jgi:hypothetical protein
VLGGKLVLRCGELCGDGWMYGPFELNERVHAVFEPACIGWQRTQAIDFRNVQVRAEARPKPNEGWAFFLIMSATRREGRASGQASRRAKEVLLVRTGGQWGTVTAVVL